MTSPARGVWIDSAHRVVLERPFWEGLAAHHVTHGSIMCERMGGGLDLTYSADDLERCAKLAESFNISLGLTVWSEPDALYLQHLEARLPALLVAARACALETELESLWRKKYLRGFPDMDAAGDALVAMMHRQRASLDVRAEATTFTGHSENSRAADVAPHMDRLYAQAYSVNARKDKDGNDKPVPWDSAFGPGHMQVTTLNLSKSIPKTGDKPAVCCGLAAYQQQWAGRTIAEAMGIAEDAARAYEPLEIRWWSSRHILTGGEASRYLRENVP